MSNNPKKVLYQELKNKLNSPEYVAMPDLITFGDRHGGMLNFVYGWLVHGNVHSEDKNNFIGDMSRGKGNRTIYEREFEPNDWEEIVKLIEKRNNEKEQIWETKRKNIEEKLNQQSNLYYYWGKSGRRNERADGWHENKGMRGFCTFLGGNGNGLTHHLYIAEEHSVLDNFSFQTGFYLIDNDKKVKKMVGHYEGGFGCSGGKTNPNNWKKYAEANDSITITPVETKDNPVEKPNRDKLNNNFKPTKRNSLSNDFALSSVNQEEINEDYLKKLFSQDSIKSISINKEGSLEIEYQNQKESEIVDNLPLQKYLIQNNQKKLSYSQLFNSNPSSPSNSKLPSSWTPYLVGGGVLIITLLIATVAYYLGHRKGKSE